MYIWTDLKLNLKSARKMNNNLIYNTLTGKIKQLNLHFPVITITESRQSGKTTLCREKSIKIRFIKKPLHKGSLLYKPYELYKFCFSYVRNVSNPRPYTPITVFIVRNASGSATFVTRMIFCISLLRATTISILRASPVYHP